MEAHGRYHNDPSFRRLVDYMYAYLGTYEVTPSELREAAIVACTMHETHRIRPMFIPKYKIDNEAMNALLSSPMLSSWPYFDPIAMFGGESGRTQSAEPNISNTPKEQNPSPLTEHVFGVERNLWGVDGEAIPYRVCVRCSLSDTYVNRFEITTCSAKLNERRVSSGDRRVRHVCADPIGDRHGKYERHQTEYIETNRTRTGDRRK